MVWTVPNLLSLFRILIIPALVYLLTYPDPMSGLLAAALFLVASVTDFFDGYLARRNHSVSDLGKILDPLADKLMVASALIMLAALDRIGEPSVPAWLVVVVIAREIAVTIIRAIALSEGIVMEADNLGKYKFILQAFAVVGLLIHYPHWGVDFYVAGIYFLGLSAVIAVWSGVNYHLQYLRLRQMRVAAPES
ncbi:MAG TPA: CDP-diacylglycerol--glycerol-3-phosphate 3-phosphatidyltransferase [candidate division Zixibacteria bacterium]|nr:CDP-diacylglycerol--glycerol-3-phosphate 3-phosphatidyltransferase [candidate division Zixibacteria bacterium]